MWTKVKATARSVRKGPSGLCQKSDNRHEQAKKDDREGHGPSNLILFRFAIVPVVVR